MARKAACGFPSAAATRRGRERSKSTPSRPSECSHSSARRYASSSGSDDTLCRQVTQQAADLGLQLAAVHDEIEHAVLEQELRPLESFGQLLPERLLDDPRTGESDERARLGQDDVAEHGE